MKLRNPPWSVLFVFAVAAAAHAQNQPRVDVVADLLNTFQPGNARDALSCEVRRPASAGGVKQDALFEHPRTAARPARVSYEIHLPSVSENQLLLLVFDLALADGIKPGTGEDGVRFIVQIDGQQSFAREVIEARWQTHAVNLAAFAGRNVELTLITDAIRNTSYDWALWGSPRVLLFRNGRLSNATANQPGRASFPVATGAIALENAGRFNLRLIPDSGETALEFSLTNGMPATGPAEWLARDFSC